MNTSFISIESKCQWQICHPLLVNSRVFLIRRRNAKAHAIFHTHHDNIKRSTQLPSWIGWKWSYFDSIRFICKLFLYHFLETKDNNLVKSFILNFFKQKMNLQQIRLQTCCLCHSLRTGCLILLWFWLIFLSLFLLAAPFSTFSYPTLVIGVAVIIQVLGLYAIYKVKLKFPVFFWFRFQKKLNLLSGKANVPVAQNFWSFVGSRLYDIPWL